jgi:soluble lytic murein transglycosylase-like protein
VRPEAGGVLFDRVDRQPRVLVAVPAFNEELTIGSVVQRVRAFVPAASAQFKQATRSESGLCAGEQTRQMINRLGAISVIILTASVVAVGQERPLSPPERAPVPLTDRDQTRAAADSLAKKEAAAVRRKEVIVPAGTPLRHISTGNAAYDQIVSEAAAQYQIDPCLIICIMRAESSFHLLARSPKGAFGGDATDAGNGYSLRR